MRLVIKTGSSWRARGLAGKPAEALQASADSVWVLLRVAAEKGPRWIAVQRCAWQVSHSLAFLWAAHGFP
ncbi:MAG: hypothetical protein V1267_04520, partial [Alphaproteobacteria bacterium]|nr:hypothetical protein [Alphaproteobacteria bacterium]